MPQLKASYHYIRRVHSRIYSLLGFKCQLLALSQNNVLTRLSLLKMGSKWSSRVQRQYGEADEVDDSEFAERVPCHLDDCSTDCCPPRWRTDHQAGTVRV